MSNQVSNARRTAAPIVEHLERRTLLAAASLLSDINTHGAGSDPGWFVESGGLLYFTAYHPMHGRELWKTDGTPAGTVLVKEIIPAPLNDLSVPIALADVAGTLFFYADDGVHGLELWKTDGTTAGTVIIKDIRPGPDGSGISPYLQPGPLPGQIFVLGDTAFFHVDAGDGIRLWRSDGTAAGTTPVEGVPPNVRLVGGVAFADALYFSNPADGYELTRLTQDGVVTRVADIYPGPVGGDARNLTVLNDRLYFTATDPEHGTEIWVTDGTAGGTRIVADLRSGKPSSSPSLLTPVGDRLFFRVTTDDGIYLAVTDGTTNGTRLIHTNGVGGPVPFDFTDVDGTLFFAYVDQTSRAGQLWKSDGTPEGTVLLRAFDGPPAEAPFSCFGYPTSFWTRQGLLYFHAGSCPGATGIWQSDGTAEGTRPTGVFTAPDERIQNAVSFQGVRYMTVSGSADGYELWRTDGTPAGTTLLKDVNPGTTSSSPRPILFGERIISAAYRPETGVELFATDLASGETRLLIDIAPGADSSDPAHFTVFDDGLLLFSARASTHAQRQLWRTDGTPEGTYPVRELSLPYDPHDPVNPANALVRIGNVLYFAASGGIWRSDATPAGTFELIRLPASEFINGVALTRHQGTLYFVTISQLRTALWRSDGTPAGTVELGAYGPTDFRQPLIASDGEFIYFKANGAELWRSDGTDERAIALVTAAQHGGRRLIELREALGSVFFTADSVLWSVDRMGTARRLSEGAVDLKYSAILNDTLFVGTQAGLLRTDGTPAGTADVLPEVQHVRDLRVFGGRLFFTATTLAVGAEPWMSDGTTAGSLLLADVYTGPLGSDARDYMHDGKYLYFAANDGLHSTELFRIRMAPRVSGDATGDERITADDYFIIDSSFLTQPENPTFEQGDFNEDGRINADDYFLIDSAFLASKRDVSLPAAVTAADGPMPTSTPTAQVAAWDEAAADRYDVRRRKVSKRIRPERGDQV